MALSLDAMILVCFGAIKFNLSYLTKKIKTGIE